LFDQRAGRLVHQPDGTLPEFPGEEIELKLQFAIMPEPRVLYDVVNILQRTVPIEPLTGNAMEGRLLNFEYYAAALHDTFQPAFVIASHPPSPQCRIRRRTTIEIRPLTDVGGDAAVSRRKEDSQLVAHTLSDDELADLIHAASEWFQAAVVPLARLTRKPYRTLIRNVESSRWYSVCVDFSEVLGHQLWQLEIEYKWGVPDITPGFGDMDAILREYTVMVNALLTSTMGQSVSPTTLTKFDWIVAVQRAVGHRP